MDVTQEQGHSGPAQLTRLYNSTYIHIPTGKTYIQTTFPQGNNWIEDAPGDGPAVDGVTIVYNALGQLQAVPSGGNETLADTLALGNITGTNDIIITDGQVIKSSTAGAEIKLSGAWAEITTSNGGYGTPYLYMDATFTGLSGTDGGIFFDSTDKRWKAFLSGAVKNLGIEVTADPTVSVGAASSITGILIGDNGSIDQASATSGLAAIFINSSSSVMKAGVDSSVILGGSNITAKTDKTVYVNKFALQEDSNLFEGILEGPAGLIADVAWTMPATSGFVAVSALAGFTGTGAYTNFTIENGVITAAS